MQKSSPLGELANAVSLRGFVLRQASSPSQSNPTGLASSSNGRASGETASFAGESETVPLCQGLSLGGKTSPAPGEDVTVGDKRGSVDLQSKDGEGEDTNPSAALSQKAALQLPFAVATPPVKIAFGAARRPRQTRNYK